MKKIIIFLIILFSYFPSYSDNIDFLINKAVENIEDTVSDNMVIGLGNIVYSDKELGSEFSNMFKEKLNIAIQRSEMFELSDMDNLDLLKEEWEFQHSGLVDENQVVRMGALNAVQALLLGNYFDNENTVNIFLKLTDVESGAVLAAEEISVPIRDISVSIIPENFDEAVFLMDELSNISGASLDKSLVNAWIEKGNGATYLDGETLLINFYSLTGCYIKIYHIDVNGKVNEDAAWYYPEPKDAAKNIKGYIAFWKGVLVSEKK